MRFFLGTHEVSWLGRAGVDLFVSHRRLASRRSLPVAVAPWALDSGGFTELSLKGRWVTSVAEYADAVDRYADEIGSMVWAAPMDWMCEPFMVDKTGLSVREHQERTVSNVLTLRGLGLPVIPVLQGWTLADYLRCAALYDEAGIDLASEETVGLGSVCRRQHTAEIDLIVSELAKLGLRLHGFGVKLTGIENYGQFLASSDSLAWSYNARKNPPLPGCPHKSCANCLRWALRWRERLLRRMDTQQLRLAV